MAGRSSEDYKNFREAVRRAQNVMRHGVGSGLDVYGEIWEDLQQKWEEMSAKLEPGPKSRNGRTFIKLHEDFACRHEMENLLNSVKMLLIERENEVLKVLLEDLLEKSKENRSMMVHFDNAMRVTDLENELAAEREDKGAMMRRMGELIAQSEKSNAERLQLIEEKKKLLAASEESTSELEAGRRDEDATTELADGLTDRQHNAFPLQTGKNVCDLQQRTGNRKVKQTDGHSTCCVDTQKKMHNVQEHCCSKKEENTQSCCSNPQNASGVKAKYSGQSDFSTTDCGGADSSNGVSSFIQALSNDMKTLEDALKYFGLAPRLEEAERSLEEVRRHKNSKEDHELLLRKFDIELQKMSLKHHPDRIRKRGGSERELEEATKLQTALNTTRTVLSFLNKMFLEDLDIDYKYGFFWKLNISVFGSEAELENHIDDVMRKIRIASEVKQQNITAEIRKFLTDGENCLKCFLEDDEYGFEKHRISAMDHLKRSVQGCEKLIRHLELVEEEFKRTENENIASELRLMKRESEGQLETLRQLIAVATRSMEKPVEVFALRESLDDYLVLPVAHYVNAILLCHAMTKPKRQSSSSCLSLEGVSPLGSRESPSSETLPPDEQSLFADAFCLASYHSGNPQLETAVAEILKRHAGGVRDVFFAYAAAIRRRLGARFRSEACGWGRPDTPVTSRPGCYARLEAAFDETNRLVREMSHVTEESRAMKEECKRMREEGREFSREIQGRLEQGWRLLESLQRGESSDRGEPNGGTAEEVSGQRRPSSSAGRAPYRETRV